MAEHVESLDLAMVWNPNSPDAVLLTTDSGPTVLALQPHPSDADQRCVVLEWTDCHFACMSPPNEEAISGHRLWEKGLDGLLWAAVVHESELIDALERQNHVHPLHHSSLFEGLTHHVLPLKECVVEVLAREVTAQRVDGTTLEAAVRAHG